jgi:hypothetical protein
VDHLENQSILHTRRVTANNESLCSQLAVRDNTQQLHRDCRMQLDVQLVSHAQSTQKASGASQRQIDVRAVTSSRRNARWTLDYFKVVFDFISDKYD